MKNQINISETQKISYEILKTIAEICETNNYRYYLMYGTLIGAVRHKGFIPWDDDIDIMMPRKDYQLLLDYLYVNSSQYPNLKVFNYDVCKEYPYMITRISDQRYRIEMENEEPYGMGVFIDIYPFDGLGNEWKKALRYGKKGDRLSSLCYQSTRKHCKNETTKTMLRKIIKFPVFIISKMIGKDFFQDKLNKLHSKIEYDSSNFVGCVVWLSGGEKDIYKRIWFEEYIMVPFEDGLFRIPKEYDKVLRHTYGDYMILPPEKERIGHHDYKVFKL